MIGDRLFTEYHIRWVWIPWLEPQMEMPCVLSGARSPEKQACPWLPPVRGTSWRGPCALPTMAWKPMGVHGESESRPEGPSVVLCHLWVWGVDVPMAQGGHGDRGDAKGENLWKLRKICREIAMKKTNSAVKIPWIFFSFNKNSN